MDMNEALQRLMDKDEIRDVMARYCHGVDRADWDLVRSTYHTDAYGSRRRQGRHRHVIQSFMQSSWVGHTIDSTP